ncbi:MAG: hypothetical protein J6U68_03855, partial [Clostridia bacterium]|nr:hypothetical protein [Clostridia bacterium]
IESTVNENHDYETEYEFWGETCEDGYDWKSVCTVCGNTEESWGAGHNHGTIRISLSKLGGCDGYIISEGCDACKQIESVVEYSVSCKLDSVAGSTETVVKDGITHTIVTKVCPDCGLKFITDSWQIAESACEKREYILVEIYSDSKKIVEFEEHNYISGHKFETTYELDGATCDDGYYIVKTCTVCQMSSRHYNKGHKPESQKVNLKEYGFCGGYVTISKCISCGKATSDTYINEKCSWTLMDTSTDGTQTYKCRNCGGVKRVNINDSEKDENCEVTRTRTISYSINDEKKLEFSTVEKLQKHEYETSYALSNGVTSCEDGVVVTNTCKYCKDSKNYLIYEHEKYEKSRIDLSEYGSDCGGYAVVSGCTCGLKNKLSVEEAECDFGSTSYDTPWIEDVVEGIFEGINGAYRLDYESYIYTCAVTDPNACAFKIRYAKYYLDATNPCYVDCYEKWQFGYNEETGSCIYEITIKVGREIHHKVEHTTVEAGDEYDCLYCGSYYYKRSYYDDNGNLTREETLSKDKIEGTAYDYSVEYLYNENGKVIKKTITREWEYADGSTQSDVSIEEVYTESIPYDAIKRTEIVSNSDGEGYTAEEVIFYYKGSEYLLYRLYTDLDGSWWRNDYEYTFDDEGCMREVSYSNSEGENHSYTENCCSYCNSGSDEPTCTQDGKRYYSCTVCGKEDPNSENEILKPYGHDWVEDGDGYSCSRCGLENANDADGNIVMEDLTEKYGNGENYVVGYYVKDDTGFTTYVSIVLADGTEKLTAVDVYAVDGIRAYAFSKAEVAAWAEENNCGEGYSVKFVFVPEGSDGSFDYAITF